MRAIVEVEKRNAPGGVKRIHSDGYVEYLEGILIIETRILGIPVLKKIEGSFVTEWRLFGLLIKRDHIAGWEISQNNPTN